MGDRLAALAELTFLDRPPLTHLRDAVWGDVPLGARELALLDTPALQRLRRVQQLGFLSWVFPGAHHTRFEHSIGVFHLTRRALIRLLQRYPDVPLGPTDARVALAAALLHDIGHYPFSHAVEELEHAVIRSHEQIGAEVIESGPIAEQLATGWKVPAVRVARLIDRGGDSSLEPGDRILRDLLSGAIDTDKLDYLVRDAHYCRVPYGLVDVDRLIQSLGLWRSAPVHVPSGAGDVAMCAHSPGEGGFWGTPPIPRPDGAPGLPPDAEWRLVVDEHGIGPLQSLIFARYMMFYNVYWHHTARIATVMFLRALQDALDAGVVAASELEQADDASVLAVLAERSPPGSGSATLIARLRQRDLYKRAITLTPDDSAFQPLAMLKQDPAGRRDLERRWCALVGSLSGRRLHGCEVLLDVPEDCGFEMPIEVLPDVPISLSHGPMPWSAVSGLGSDDMARFHAFIRRIRVVAADAELAAVVRDHRGKLMEDLS